jgi:hypothetical protein
MLQGHPYSEFLEDHFELLIISTYGLRCILAKLCPILIFEHFFKNSCFFSSIGYYACDVEVYVTKGGILRLHKYANSAYHWAK